MRFSNIMLFNTEVKKRSFRDKKKTKMEWRKRHVYQILNTTHQIHTTKNNPESVCYDTQSETRWAYSTNSEHMETTRVQIARLKCIATATSKVKTTAPKYMLL